MSQFQEKTQINRIERFPCDIIRLTLESPEIASRALPGQFVMIRTGTTKDPLLRRPFSISQTSNGRYFQILFKVVGKGTSWLAHCREGEYVSVLGPLGKGFTYEPDVVNCLVGGGMGIAPLLFLGKYLVRHHYENPPIVVVGARTREELEPFVEDFFEMGLSTHTATDDGSLGHRGLVTDIISILDLRKGTMLHVCGPYPMMSAVHLLSQRCELNCQVSMETSMACGMGACLGCIVPSAHGGYAHACSEGPVFDSKELLWQVK
jgi:dihydroorotate dehydrogenase electron transfer subunit